MQVAGYARVSSRRQAQAQTIEQQLDRLRTHAAACGWELVQEHVFRDDGYSGASLGRPGLDRLRDAAAGARLDRVLITAPDRLARNSVHQVLLVEELQGHGVMVEFLDRPMYAGPAPGWPRSAAPRHAANSVGRRAAQSIGSPRRSGSAGVALAVVFCWV